MAKKLESLSEEVLTTMFGRRKKFLPHSSASKDLLLLLLVAGGISISLVVAPTILAAGGAVATLLNRKNHSRQFRKSFYYLRSNNLINVERKNKKWELTLTSKGKRRAETYSVSHLTLPKKKRWGGTWYLIIFDIPHEQKHKRDALRYFIKRHDCYQLQKSIWVYPFDCRKEVGTLREVMGIDKQSLQVVMVTALEGDERLRKHFSI